VNSLQIERQQVATRLAGRPRNSKALQREYVKLTARMIAQNMGTNMDDRIASDLSYHAGRAALWFDRVVYATDSNVRKTALESGQWHLAKMKELADQPPAPVDTPAIPSDRPCAEVNPVLWAYFSRVTGRNGDPSAVWSEADVVQCLDGKLPDRR